MRFLRKTSAKVTAFVLALVLLLSAVPAGVFSAVGQAQKAPLQIAVVADTHFYPQALMGNDRAAFEAYCKMTARQFSQTNALLDAGLGAIALHAQTNGTKYLILPGDLTKDGEYEGHTELAARLELFERETGIQVMVINGNHDLNNSGAEAFVNGKMVPSRTTTPEEFRTIYANLGYDLAYNTYTPPAGEKAGMLSYSVKLEGGYRFIALDGGKYSSDNTEKGIDEHETGGNFSEGLMAWALAEMADAERNGETVIGMMHHNLVPQFETEPSLFQDFVIDYWMERAEAFADAGMRYVFTGHMHANNMSSHVSDNGHTIVDCQTPSLTGFPNMFREVYFDNTGDEVKATFESFDVDCEFPVVFNGIAYETPYKYTFSFHRTYGDDGLANFAAGMAQGFMGGFLDSITEQGGLYGFLTGPDFNLQKLIVDAVGGSLTFGGVNALPIRNIMSFIKDLAEQLDALFIQQPQALLDIAYSAVDKLVSMPVSDYPCTAFIDTLHFGDPDKPGTLQDAGYSILAYLYEGNQDIGDDEFMLDTIDYFKNRDGANNAYATLKEILLNDLIEGALLSSLNFNPGAFFPEDSMLKIFGDILDALILRIFSDDNSFLNIINSTLAFLPLEFKNLDDIVEIYAEEYLTQSQLDSVGYTIAEIIESLVVDENPGFQMDCGVTLTYTGPVPVSATAENFRLPSNVAVTFGNDTGTTRNITWLTKYSVTGTDIEVIPYSASPVFTGVPTTGPGIETTTEKVTRSFPGVDLGVIGILDYSFTLVRHTIQLTGLAPGQTYSYRVGDAAKGWWSPPAVITTADNTEAFTFFHMTDPQSQNVRQYGAWTNTVNAAFAMHPQGRFIMSTGDLVDNHHNIKQWKWLLNTPAERLMSTVLMPTAGNHEKSDYALDRNFLLPTAPDQDRSTGVFYSFDYNNAHFIVLNTNDLNSRNALSAAQINWLRQDAAASDAPWKILALHKAIYSNGSHIDDKDVVAIRKQLASLLPELGIDLVLQGHDHVYLRTDAMSDNKVVASETRTVNYNGLAYDAKYEPQGTVYVIGACAGVKNYHPKDVSETDKLFPRAESIVDTILPVFSSIQIDGSMLYFDAYTVDGTQTQRIDSFAIEKQNTATAIVDDTTIPNDTAEPDDTAVPDDTTVPDDTAVPDDATVPDNTSVSEDKASSGDTDSDTAIPHTGGESLWMLTLLPALAFACAVAIKASKKKQSHLR